MKILIEAAMPIVNKKTQEQKILELLKKIGNMTECAGCQRAVFWVKGKKSSFTVDSDASFHINTCQASPRFKK